MVYYDANVFVYAYVEARGNALGDAGRGWLAKARKGKVAVSTSALTWDEVVWAVRKIAGPEASGRASREFIELPNLQLVSADRDIVERAHRLMGDCGLKPRDAVHAASALDLGERDFVSSDSDFDRVPGLKRIPLVD